MGTITVICPEHGIIEIIQMDCMWLGHPPNPIFENAYCPKCGKKTTIERQGDDTTYKAYWSSERAKNDRYR